MPKGHPDVTQRKLFTHPDIIHILGKIHPDMNAYIRISIIKLDEHEH